MNRRNALRSIALLTGGTLSISTVAGLLGGCQASSSEGWTPRALSGEQSARLGDLVELIIPTTDTPGARDAGVLEFIDRMLGEWHVSAERERFLAGLERVEEIAQREHDAAFIALEASEQSAILAQMPDEPDLSSAEEVEVATADAWGEATVQLAEHALDAGQEDTLAVTVQPFFQMLKELTLVGYYTSEVGGTEELQYVHSPGRFEGCMPIEELGRAWV